MEVVLSKLKTWKRLVFCSEFFHSVVMNLNAKTILFLLDIVKKKKTQYVYLNTIDSIEIDCQAQKEFETDSSGANKLRVKFWCNQIRDNIENYMYTQ